MIVRRLTRSVYVWCVLVVAAEALVILLALKQGSAPILGHDGIAYDHLASNLVQHGSYSSAVAAPFYPNVTRMPGYPMFLAFFYVISLRSLILVRIAQFILVAAMACLVYGIASQLSSVRTARISALLCATYLPFLWLASYQLTEVLTSFLVTLLVFLLVRAMTRPVSAGFWVCVGLTLAAATYVRPEVAALGILVAVSVLLAGRSGYIARSWSASAIVLVTMALALAPWAVRNISLTDSFTPFGTSAGRDLFTSAEQYSGTVSNTLPVDEWKRHSAHIKALLGPALAEGGDVHSQLAADEELRHRGLTILRNLSLGTVLTGVPPRVFYLWGTADFSPAGWSWSTVAHRLAQLQYVLLTILVLVGIAMRRRSLTREWPLWLPAVYFTALHLIFSVEARYTLPARPALFVYAGFATATIISHIARSHGEREAGDPLHIAPVT